MSKNKTEEFVVDGEEVLAKIKELINEGNIRRIIIKDMDDKTLIEIPLTIGVVVAVLAPVLAAVGALAAIVTKCKIIVEKKI
ncbi:MAG: DUF4342 domain-containing protein [Candidatus Saccharibacteria bacterium]